MRFETANGINLHISDEGNSDDLPVVFANSLGTDFRLWDKVVRRLPPGLRVIRYDKRGHGLSECLPGPYALDDLVSDIAGLLDRLVVEKCVFVGLSIGGLIAQQLTLIRPDLVRAVLLANTAAKIGDDMMWRSRMSTIQRNGIEAVADDIICRWFSETFRESNASETLGWTAMLSRTPVDGYLGCCSAIMATDLRTEIHAIEKPVTVIAGSEDGATPSDIVRAMANQIQGAEFYEIKGVGHLPCVEAPDQFAALLTDLVRRSG